MLACCCASLTSLHSLPGEGCSACVSQSREGLDVTATQMKALQWVSQQTQEACGTRAMKVLSPVSLHMQGVGQAVNRCHVCPGASACCAGRRQHAQLTELEAMLSVCHIQEPEAAESAPVLIDCAPFLSASTQIAFSKTGQTRCLRSLPHSPSLQSVHQGTTNSANLGAAGMRLWTVCGCRRLSMCQLELQEAGRNSIGKGQSDHQVTHLTLC